MLNTVNWIGVFDSVFGFAGGTVALAPCRPEEMNERESTAIRAFAPKFNTSIPSVPQSEGRMPDIIGYASVFQDQLGPGGAFDPINLRQQMERAKVDPSPPWRQGKQRKKTGKREPPPELPAMPPSVQLTGNELRGSRRSVNVSMF